MLILSSILFATFVAIGATLSLSYSNNNYLKAQNEEQEYTLTLNSSTQFNPSNTEGVVNTALGNPITFNYSSYSTQVDKFGKFTKYGNIQNATMISGLKTITVTFEASDPRLRLEYSSATSFWSEILTSGETFNFEDRSPLFFNVINMFNYSLTIEEIVITYSCEVPEIPVEESGLSFDLISEGTAYEVKAATSYLYAAFIPSTHDGLPVTAIADNAFSTCAYNLRYISLPDTITKIGDGAFNGCQYLSDFNLVLPDGVTTIGSSTFSGAYFASIKIGSGTTSISQSAFNDIGSLKEIVVSEDNPNYSSYSGAFYDKNRTVMYCCPRSYEGELVLPETVTSLPSFEYCEKITAFSIGPNCDYYSTLDGALFNKTKTEYVAFPRGYVGSYTIPNTITAIPSSLFNSRRFLTSVSIPNSVTSIGIYAFKSSGITSITIPNGVKTIDYGAFSDTKITSIVIPDSVTDLGQNCFEYTKLTSATLGSGVKIVRQYLFYACSDLTSISMHDSVWKIEDHAFENCSKLATINLPGSLSSIGYYSFAYCSKLATINFNNTTARWNSVTKDSNWKTSGVPAKEVVCTDGTVPI